MINVHKTPKNKMPLRGLELIVMSNPTNGRWTYARCLDCGLEGKFFKTKGNPHCSVCSSTNITQN